MNEEKSSRGGRGVVIILSPTSVKVYKDAGNSPPNTSSLNSSIITSSRVILIILNFKIALYNKKRVFRKK